MLDQGLLTVLGDATGHGIAPALSVTQMHAMLRMAFRLGADLETAFLQVNNQLAATLADDRFITAFIGLLDPATHRMRFHSGGQAPILHFQAASGTCARYNPTSFPLAAMPLTALRPAVDLELMPGDILVLLSDGIYEYNDRHNEEFGEGRVEAILRIHHGRRMARTVRHPARRRPGLRAGRGAGGRHHDRPGEAGGAGVIERRDFRRSFDSLAEIFAFTADFFARHGIDAALLPAVDLTLEELFTNMVKYSPAGDAHVSIEMATAPGGVEVTLTDYDVERFDVTQSPDANIHLPIEERRPGGLGLHLIRRLVDSIDYEYSNENRRSRITFRKTTAAGTDSGGATRKTGEGNARD